MLAAGSIFLFAKLDQSFLDLHLIALLIVGSSHEDVGNPPCIGVLQRAKDPWPVIGLQIRSGKIWVAGLDPGSKSDRPAIVMKLTKRLSGQFP